MSWFRLRRRVWEWSSVAVFVSACAIDQRVVEERPDAASGGAVLGTSSGSGGGGGAGGRSHVCAGVAGSSLGKGGANAGVGGKPDLNAPDPAFPPFKNGGLCRTGKVLPPHFAEDGGAAAGGDSGSGGCVKDCASTFRAKGIQPGLLVVDGGEIFWADLGKAGAVLANTVSGGSRLARIADSLPIALAVDATWLYVQTNRALERLPRAGGKVETLVSEQSMGSFAVDSSDLYFLANTNGGGNEVRRLALDTGKGEMLGKLGGALFNVALDTDNVFLLAKAEVLRLPKCQEGQFVLAVTTGFGGGLAVDAGYVYWADDAVISRVPKKGGATETVVPAVALDGNVVVDGSFVYWGDESGEVRRVPVEGGAPETVANGLGYPVVHAVDEHDVYFVDGDDIRVAHK